MLFLFFVLASSETSWEDPETGITYDWSILSRKTDNYYEVVDSRDFFLPSVYSFNFGSDLPDSCTGQFPAAMETIELADGWVESCSILGRSDMQTVTTVDKGIEITYSGGEYCYETYAMSTRQISFRLICSETEGEWEIVQSTFQSYCHIILKKKTTAGCPREIRFNWMWGLMICIAGVVIYCAVGTISNVSRGKGWVVPNYQFWARGIEVAQDAAQSVVENGKRLCPNKGKKGDTYEMV